MAIGFLSFAIRTAGDPASAIPAVACVVHAVDAKTFVAVSLMFGLVAMLASYVPARRATKVDPMVALRSE